MDKNKRQILKRFLMIGRQLKHFNLHQLLHTTDLKQTEFAVLHMLERYKQNGQNEMKISDVAMHLQNATSTISPIIQSLVEKGYITRTESAKDRRISMIVLTEQGEAKMKKIMHELSAQFAEIVTIYGEDKITLLLDLFDELVDTVLKLNEEEQHD